MTAAAERGSTVIADRAVRRIAARAAWEADLAGRHAEPVRSSASVRGPRTDVAVAVRLPYPAVLGQDGERVRERMAGRVAELTGLTVGTAQVHIHDLAPDRAARPAPTGERGSGAARGSRRTWSQRRVPAALAALAGTAGCAILVYDLVAVHAFGRRPAAWRRAAVDWLATHGPGDTAVVAGGAVAVVVGLWLLSLALTPGLRDLLVMTPPPGGPRPAVLERSAASELLRDAVDTVSGVTRTRVRVGRRRVRVTARLGFGDRGTARAQVRTAAEGALAGLGLARTPQVRVTLRTEPHWRPPESHDTDADAAPGWPDHEGEDR